MKAILVAHCPISVRLRLNGVHIRKVCNSSPYVISSLPSASSPPYLNTNSFETYVYSISVAMHVCVFLSAPRPS